VSAAGLRRHHHPPHPGWTLDVLLPELSALARLRLRPASMSSRVRLRLARHSVVLPALRRARVLEGRLENNLTHSHGFSAFKDSRLVRCADACTVGRPAGCRLRSPQRA
jgi:hypothetical protein